MRKTMKRNPILSQGWRDCFLGLHNVVHSATMHRFSLSLSLFISLFPSHLLSRLTCVFGGE